MTFVLVASLITMTASGLLMAVLERVHRAPASAERRLGGPRARPVDPSALRTLVVINSAQSVVLLLGVPVLAFSWLFREGELAWATLVGEAFFVLALYDLLYYGMHRALHHKRVMRFVHRVHHLARAPSARESMYVHPLEFFLGLALLFLCVALVGPVHVSSYVAALVPFQLVNVILHSGLDFAGGRLGFLVPWSHGHHGHHGVDVQKNFGQFTHLWDHLFGTALR